MDDNAGVTPVDYDPFAQQAPSSAPSAIPGTTPVDFDPFAPPAQGNAAMAGDAGAPDFGQDDAANVAGGQAALAASKPGQALADAGKAAALSTGAGLGKLPWQLSKVTALAAGTLPMGYDAITGPFRKGGNDHAATDAWFANMVAPADTALDTLNDVVADQAKTHPGIANAGAMMGDTASNLSAAVLTGGGAELPEAITQGGKMFADLSTKELVRNTASDALATSATMSAPTALAHGEEAGEKVYNETGSGTAGLAAGLGTAGATVLTNTLPAGVNGSLADRIAAGAISGGAGSEASREITNAVVPDKDKQAFNWHDTGWGMIMGAGFGLAFHGQAQSNPQDTVFRFNELQKGVAEGNPEAIQTNTVLSQLTNVDGLSDHAMDAAVAGTAAHQAVQNATHEDLMAKSGRYREIFASATPELPVNDAIQYAKDTYAAEEQTNTSWDSYLQSSNFNDKQASTGKIYQQVKDLYSQAEKVVPDVDMQKISRWAFNESRTPLEVRKALTDAISEKGTPDYIDENYGDDFHDDGFLTQAAFDKDQANHPDKIPAAWPNTPEVADALDQARINPYKLDDGRLAVIGDHDAIASATAHVLSTTGVSPHIGDIFNGNHTETELRPGSGRETAGPGEGTAQGNRADQGTDAQGGQHDEANGGQEAEDAQALTSTEAMKQHGAVIDRRLAALDEGAKGVRQPRELARLGRESGELEDLVRAQAQAKADGVVLSPDRTLTPDELAQAHTRMGEIKLELEAHRAAVKHESDAVELRGKLAKADDQGIADIATSIMKPRNAFVRDTVGNAPGVSVSNRGEVRVDASASPEAAQRAMDAAANDTAADTTEFNEPTAAQAAAGNYRKGGVLFKSPEGDVRVRVENPDGSVRKGKGWSRPIKGAHYGYLPGTKSADGEPVDVFLTRRAHDDSLPVAVISQHDPATGKFDELKVVMGAKDRAEAMALYRRQYPGGMANRMMPKGEGNVVMMSRAKFAKYIKTEALDVPPHPISAKPIESLRTEREPEPMFNMDKRTPNKTIADRVAEAKAEKERLSKGDTFVRDDVADTRVNLDKVSAAYEPRVPEKTEELMRKAASGELPRRWPLAVRDNGDGSYEILKGNDTVTVARKFGVKDMPATVVDKKGPESFLNERGILKGPPAKQLTDMYEKSAALKPKFDATIKDIADRLGVELHLAGIKGRERAEQKIKDDYAGDASKLNDLVRATLVIDTPMEAKAAMKAVADNFKVITTKDTLSSEKPGFLGYRDAKMIVDIGKGQQAEIQFNVPEMVAAKKGGGHDIYKIMRSMDPTHPEYFDLERKSEELYGEAWSKAAARSRTAGENDETSLSNSARDTGVMPRRVASSSETSRLPVDEDGQTNLPGETSTTGTPSPPKSKSLMSDTPTIDRAKDTTGAGVEGIQQLDHTGANDRGETNGRPEAVPTAEAGGLRGRGGVRGGKGRVSTPTRAGLEPLSGLPATVKVLGEKVTFGPDPRAQDAAKAYAKESGIPYARPDGYAPVDEARAARIAKAFDDMPHAPNDPVVKAAYKAMIDETMAQWSAIKKTGLKVEFIKPGMDDPYAANPRLAIMDVNQNNHLWVFPTEGGFGGENAKDVDVSNNPLLTPVGESIDGHPMVANDVFRIVHDYFGHVKEGVGFRADGEENAWRSHAAMYSPLARRAMTTETRGQNSWVNFGPYAEHNRTASGADTEYAPQKTGLLPDWVSNEGAPRSVVEQAKHASDIAAHAEKVVADWKNRPEIQVVAHRNELDPQVQAHLDAILGPDDVPKGMYSNGKVTLFADKLIDKADAERTILHETIGHLGLRGVMGDRLNGVLDDIHASIKDTPKFASLYEGYKNAYGRRGGDKLRRDVTEEYLAKIAEDGTDPGVWSKFVAHFRQWARDHGFVSKWTENDLRNLMAGVARDMREGRVSLAGFEPPVATFDEDTGTVASTYVGAAGRGTVTQDYAGTGRRLSIGGLKADIRSSEINGEPALSVDDLVTAKPSDLLRLTRFAAEEGKGVVAIGKDTLPRDVLERSGIPFVERPGHWELPASQGVEGPPMFSLRNQAHGTPEQESILKRAVAHPESNLTWWDRMGAGLRDIRDNVQSGETAMAVKQSYVDAMAPIERYERAQNGGLLLDAQHSAYKAAWMAKNNEQITAAIMRLGVPEYSGGSFVPKAGNKGLLEIFQPLFHTPDGKGLDRLWEGYAMAKRSNELIKQTNDDGTPREKLLTQDDIDKLLDLEKQHPIFKKVFDDYQTFNKQLLDLAVERGTLSKETADLWSQNMYVPFYRALEENKNESNEWRQGKGISGKKVSSMRLYGSDKAVEPIIENIIKNTGAVLDKVYANEAMRRVVSLTDGIGMERLKIPMKGVELSLGEIEKALGRIGYQMGGKNPKGGYRHSVAQADMDKLIAFFKQSKPIGPDIVSVYEKGKPIYYRVSDANLYRAVTAFNDLGKFDRVLGWVFGVPKKVLTLGVTLDPRFMYRNWFRDTLTNFMQTGTNPNVLKGMIKNTAEVWKDGEFINRLRMAGYNGNEYFKVNEMREFMRDMHADKGVTVLNAPSKLWHAYHKVGFVSEQMNRMNIAHHVLDNGGSMAEAAWQAQNTLNFSKRGDSKAFQLLIRSVPFLNARIQGLNRLYEGVTGKDVTVDRRKAVFSFAMKAAGMMLAGLALAKYNESDPRYQRLPEQSKDTYYHFWIGDHHFMLPKPFELGSILTTIPERIMRKVDGKDTERTFVESMMRVATGIFSFNPLPQAIKPIIEDVTNTDFFSSQPIVNQSLSGLEPGAQFTPQTSPTLKTVAQHMPDIAPNALRSPERLEHLYREYGGQVGTYLMMMADAATRKATNAPVQPASRYGNKLVGAVEGTFGFGNDATDPRTKYTQQLYDAQDNADRAAQTVTAYLKQGNIEAARSTMDQNKTALSYRSTIHQVATQMKELRQVETQVYQSPSMDADQKREKLDQINSVKRRLLERVAPILETASDYQH